MASTQEEFKEIQLFPITDNRKYHLVNKNGVDILVITDEKATTGAISTAFEVGSSDTEKIGLAHFLEHVIFQGAKGDKTDFMNFVAEKGGETNAYTDKERTVFACSFSHTKDNLEKTISKFVNLFINPAFEDNVGDTNKEKKAVNSEYVKDGNIDSWKEHLITLREIKKEYAETVPHRHTRFGCGTSFTLKDITIEDLKNFFFLYRKNPINAVIYTKNDINEIKDLLNIFDKLNPNVNNDKSMQINDDNPFEKLRGKMIRYKPLGEINSFSLNFALNPLFYSPELGDMAHLKYLFDSKQNLFNHLFDRALVSSMSSGISSNFSYGSVFTVDFVLTDKGAEEIETTIIPLFFHYVDTLISHYSNDENIDDFLNKVVGVLDTNFNIQDKNDPFNTVMDSVVDLVRNKNNLENVIKSSMTLQKDEVKQRFLSDLESLRDNCFVIIADTSFDETDGNVLTEEWFDTKYKVQNLIIEPNSNGYLNYVPFNPEIPETVLAVSSPEKILKPECVTIFGNGKLYRTNFNLKKLQVIARIRLNFHKKDQSLNFNKGLDLEHLLVYQIAEYILSIQREIDSYNFDVTGNSFSFEVDREGFTLVVDSNKLLFEGITETALADFQNFVFKTGWGEKNSIIEIWFQAAKGILEREIKSRKIDQPYSQARKNFGKFLDSTMFSEEQCLEALDELSFERMYEVINDYRKIPGLFSLQTLIVGKISKKEESILKKQIKKYFDKKIKVLDTEEMVSSPLSQTELSLEINTLSTIENDKNSAVVLAVPFGISNIFKDECLIALQNFFSDEAMGTLRTKENLGYIATAVPLFCKGLSYLTVIVQSEDHSPDDLQEKTRSFYDNLMVKLNEKNLETIKTHFSNRINKLEKEVDSLYELLLKQWTEIQTGRFMFNIDERRIKVLEEIIIDPVNYVKEFLKGKQKLFFKVFAADKENKFHNKETVYGKIHGLSDGAKILPLSENGEKFNPKTAPDLKLTFSPDGREIFKRYDLSR